jgi:hypothetical protein
MTMTPNTFSSLEHTLRTRRLADLFMVIAFVIGAIVTFAAVNAVASSLSGDATSMLGPQRPRPPIFKPAPRLTGDEALAMTGPQRPRPPIFRPSPKHHG